MDYLFVLGIAALVLGSGLIAISFYESRLDKWMDAVDRFADQVDAEFTEIKKEIRRRDLEER